MSEQIRTKEDFFKAVERLQAFCKKTGLHPASFVSAVDLYNQAALYSESHSIPLPLAAESSRKHERTAIVTDIHGNWEALSAALQDIKNQTCDRIVCLGDIVDGGLDDERVLTRLIELGATMIRGNHDEFPPIRMDMKLQGCLKSLPKDIVEDDIIFTHISPREKELPVRNPIEAWNVFDETSWRVMFIGHLHYPVIFGANGSSSCNAEMHDFKYTLPFQLNKDDRYIICPGPIGYSRDDIAKVRYGIYDSKHHTFEVRTVEGPMLTFTEND